MIDHAPLDLFSGVGSRRSPGSLVSEVGCVQRSTLSLPPLRGSPSFRVRHTSWGRLSGAHTKPYTRAFVEFGQWVNSSGSMACGSGFCRCRWTQALPRCVSGLSRALMCPGWEIHSYERNAS